MTRQKIMSGFLVTIGVLFLATQMSACKDSTGVDPGSLGRNTYSNEFFGFKMSLPNNWHLLDQQGMNAVSQAWGRAVAGKNKRLKAAVKAAENGSCNLVMAYQHPVGTQVPFYPAIGAGPPLAAGLIEHKTSRGRYRVPGSVGSITVSTRFRRVR